MIAPIFLLVGYVNEDTKNNRDPVKPSTYQNALFIVFGWLLILYWKIFSVLFSQSSVFAMEMFLDFYQ